MRRRKRIDRVLLLAFADSLAGRLEEICRACDRADLDGRLPVEITPDMRRRARDTIARYRPAVRGENYD